MTLPRKPPNVVAADLIGGRRLWALLRAGLVITWHEPHMGAPYHPLLLGDLVAIDPRIGEWLAECARVQPSARPCEAPGCVLTHTYCCAEEYHRRKPELQQLVGWYRPEYHPALSSTEAYDVVVQTLVEHLPPCVDPEACGCGSAVETL